MPPRSHHDFLVKANSFELKQLVEEPTRFGPFNTLNLMLTNVPHRVNKTIIIPGISDHDIPLTELSQKPHYIKQMCRKIPIYRRADWLKLSAHLQTNIEHLEQNPRQPNALLNDLKNNKKEAETMFISTKIAKKRDSLPWIALYLDCLIAKRNNLQKKSKRAGRLNPEERYRQLKILV